ncbi:3-hydroxyacyl-CoA dehydrogenase [Streptomyces sp. NBC_00481]|uniref:3-hydroxyacyl-CoA dehydrogenase n=1 Tax=unclassified Streptomyces TaxID=2593676 RepID=UPI002DDC6AF5|nr:MULTISPECIES: 3-hydroxyacyl-CoA dehydrogenase [unclassified Streptomyces]WRY94084.1 3-hydroxyacyl-CoA dehydrogenase [Streptomyces sp. NBC_00481]
MSQPLAHICVIGAGTMGRGIAQVALASGHPVHLVDPDEAQLKVAGSDITARLSRRDPAAPALVKARLRTFTDLTQTPTDAPTVVVEAILERLDIKQAVLRRAAEHFGPTCVLATNTSSLSVTAIAAGTPDPSRVVGMHFFNPVPVMRLVEVVRGLQTSDEVVDTVAELALRWGKSVAHVRSVPGFIVNRVARAFYGESLRLVEERASTPETIDELMRSAGGFRMGPFELMDLIGNDVNFAVTQSVWTSYHYDPRFAPSLIQSELIAAGRFGRKTGQGFYEYGESAERARPLAAEVKAEAVTGATRVVLHGSDDQLEAVLTRSGLEFGREVSDTARIEFVSLGSVMVTRGRSAREESARRSEPVLLLDRCLEPSTATALALASADAALTDVVVALLDRAGIHAFPMADIPGLVVARVLSMIANEAWETAHHGVATPDDIDLAMLLGTNYPIGPFAWSARWSTRRVLELLDALWSSYHDPRYRASHALRAEVQTISHDGLG